MLTFRTGKFTVKGNIGLDTERLMSLKRWIKAGSNLISSPSTGRDRRHEKCLSELIAHIVRGDLDAAVALYKQMPRAGADNPYYLIAKGKMEVDDQQFTAAKNTFLKAKLLLPDLPILHLALGNVALSLNDHEEAVGYFRQHLQLDGMSGIAWLNYGVALTRTGDLTTAKRSLLKAIDLVPDAHLATLKLARVYYLEKDYSSVLNTLRAISSVDNDAEAMELQVLTLVAMGDYEIALEKLENFGSSFGDSPRIHAYLGFVYHAMDKFELSEASYTKAVGEDPDYIDAQYNLGILYRDMGNFELARECFLKVRRLDQDHRGAIAGLATCMLSVREYEKGWEYYEYRIYLDDYSPRHFDLSRWSGETAEPRNLLVTAEQGLGDEIMFASCIPDLLEAEFKLVLESHPKLGPLFSRSFPSVEIVARSPTLKNDWIADYHNLDCYLPAGSLPNVFRRKSSSYPKHSGYLVADPKKTESWQKRLADLGEKPKIGISWSGGVKRTRSSVRSIQLSSWEQILKLPFEFISLQYTDCEAEISEVNQQFDVNIHHWKKAIDDYDETAALVKALDVVVSVQTSLVHLSGALGAPTIAMISAAPEWRYSAEGEDMLWYPSVRLVRQTKLFEWREVLDQVGLLLTKQFC